MYLLFITTLINEFTGLLPITIIQGGYIIINPSINLQNHIYAQIIISLAFAVGNFVLYFLGKYGSIPLLKIFKRFKLFSHRKSDINVKPKFYWILLMRSIPFFPAKHVSIGLGALKYSMTLFFISSWVGIFIRGMILVFLFKIGIMIS